MTLSNNEWDIIKKLLSIEHQSVANKLGFIEGDSPLIDEPLLISSIGLLDKLSRRNDEVSLKIVITCAAILWTYRNEDWGHIRDFLILVLSRAGFSPSSIMLEANRENNEIVYDSVGSLITQFNITVHQLCNEIIINDKVYLVTGFQKSVWDKLSEVNVLGISAPTSAGKSFIISLKAIDVILKNGGDIVYVVPTLSLVAQVSADFNKLLKEFAITSHTISTTYSLNDSGNSHIYVLTQEKAISAFSQTESPFYNTRILIVDEIQNIEKVANEDDQRSKTLYDALIEFRHSISPDLIILSGPRIKGLKKLGVEIFADENIDEKETKESPVATFTYSISKTGNDYFFNQYSNLLEKPVKLIISKPENIKGYGGSQYKADFVEYLSTILNNLGIESKNIIFSPTSSQARKTAIELTNFVIYQDKISEPLVSLIKYVKDTVHENYDICLTLPKGIVYHHGKTPSHIRSVIEHAIRQKMICNIVCTTTLMQGVNLPAQNVIMRNPFLAINAIKGTKPKLTNYEVANLRGRAGRLLKDFIGRTYVLEENSFGNTSEQTELFSDTAKELSSGYGIKYKKHKKEISESLLSNSILGEEHSAFGYLITYIRQTILKHGDLAQGRLSAVGIELSQSQIEEYALALSQSLNIPIEICAKNRYWDPMDLNILYSIKDELSIPTSIKEQNIDRKLLIVLQRFKSEFPQIYFKYFGVSDGLLESVCITAKEWMKEVPLKTILGKPYFDDSDKIDLRISLIQKEISYGLPILLKPLYDIKVPTNMFLRFIEIGAYKPIARKMIELNIPRETAIFLSNGHFRNVSVENDSLNSTIINRLREVKNEVDYWRRIQFEGII
ncbi:MAG TPA: DEAD/DEAH box helicase [Cytophagales bacterium]|nr:DEAD/DEAH box helicase [Cytophagales bacterium]